MAKQSLRSQLFERTLDGKEAADWIMPVLRHAIPAGSVWRRDLLRAHFLACYHNAHWDNDHFDRLANDLRLSNFADRSELISYFSGDRGTIALVAGRARAFLAMHAQAESATKPRSASNTADTGSHLQVPA